MTWTLPAGLTARDYEPADAPEIVELWRRTIGDRYPLTLEVFRQCLDRNPSFRSPDAVVVLAGPRIVGFAYMGRYRVDDARTADRRGRAWLQAVLVDGPWRLQGIGRAMVRSLAGPLATDGVERVEAGGGSFYFWPGFPDDLPWAYPFGAALGFERPQPAWDLHGDVQDLDDLAAQATLERLGLHLVPGRPDDRADLLDFLFREFGAEWWHETTWFLDEAGDIGDFLLLRDGERRTVGMARLHTPATRPIGPPHFWAERRPPNAGGLGPIGVAAANRGHGVGQALLTASLARLRDQGLPDVVIDFTTLLGFYGHLGFAPWISYREASAPIHRLIDAGG